MVCIIDYGMGNTGSVRNALEHLGYEAIISARPDDFMRASHLILPGVGAFADGMKQLRMRSIVRPLEEQVLQEKKPFLGICLGMQMLATFGEEGEISEGLGWIRGRTTRLAANTLGLRLPHVGWNDVQTHADSRLLSGIKRSIFYFTHSYHLIPANKDIIFGTTEYGEKFTACIESDNIFGVQFHPEKSQQEGLKVLKNFLAL